MGYLLRTHASLSIFQPDKQEAFKDTFHPGQNTQEGCESGLGWVGGLGTAPGGRYLNPGPETPHLCFTQAGKQREEVT